MLEPGMTAPDFEVQDHTGRTVRLSDYRGKDVVLWRTEQGVLNASDPYCLHLGGNIGVGGTVQGDEIVCPWHHWHWNGEGHNTLIPYSDRLNKKAGP